MANKIVSYQCPHCKHIQKTDFSVCPACGTELITGKTHREIFKYVPPTIKPEPWGPYEVTC